LKNYHLTPNTALFIANKIVEYLMSARINDGSWHGPVENFIINWQNQFHLYERLVPTTSHYKDEQKLAMLQVAVHPLRELRQVKNIALLIKQTNGGKDLTYKECVQILSYAASDYDNGQVPAKNKRQVYQSEIQEDDFQNYEDNIPDSEPFDIDTPVETIQAYAANYRPNTKRAGTDNQVRMPKERWLSLDDKTKSIWDSTDDKFKNIILGYTTSSPSFSTHSGKSPPKSPTKPPFSSRKAFLSEMLQAFCGSVDEAQEDAAEEVPTSSDLEPDPPSDLLINAAKGTHTSTLPPGDIRRVMSKNSKRSVHTTCIEYKVSYHKEHHGILPSLIDRGANGGVAGSDVRVIFKNNRTADIRGTDNHHCTNIDIGTVGGVIKTHKGPVIGIFHQYALLNKGSSIHSPCQFEWYKHDVNNKSVLVPGGLQRIQTLDGYVIPLSIQDGLTRLHIRPYTDHEFDTLPHVMMTTELEWDPSALDHEFTEDDQWGEPPTIPSSYDDVSEYKHRVAFQHHSYFQRQDGNSIDDVIDQCVYATHSSPSAYEFDNTLFYDAYDTEILDAPTTSHTLIPKQTVKREPDFQKLRPMFGWLSTDIIQRTFKHTTQYARLPTATMLKKALGLLIQPLIFIDVTKMSHAISYTLTYQPFSTDLQLP
jgi:hypothetical protein